MICGSSGSTMEKYPPRRISPTLIGRLVAPSPDYLHYEGNSLHCVGRGATLEERRHQRKCFIVFPALGTMFDLFAANLIATRPASIFKAQLLCLRSARVAPRSQFYRE